MISPLYLSYYACIMQDLNYIGEEIDTLVTSSPQVGCRLRDGPFDFMWGGVEQQCWRTISFLELGAGQLFPGNSLVEFFFQPCFTWHTCLML